MNANEFKAWFEGFVSAMEAQGSTTPTQDQWKLIKERVAKMQALDGFPNPPGPSFRDLRPELVLRGVVGSSVQGLIPADHEIWGNDLGWIHDGSNADAV